MLVRHHATCQPVMVSPETVIGEARAIMTEHGVEHLSVVDDRGTLLGLLAAPHVLTAPEGSRCDAVMTPDPITVRGETPLVAALRLMCERRISALPVVSDGRKLEGLMTLVDLLTAAYRLLGLDRPGVCVEVALLDRAGDPITALDALRHHGIEPLSVIVGCVRDDGDEPALYIRLPEQRAREAETHLCRAGLVLLVPENDERMEDRAGRKVFAQDASSSRTEGTSQQRTSLRASESRRTEGTVPPLRHDGPEHGGPVWRSSGPDGSVFLG